jgi:Delta 1-pyrroline-5-carboxylate dehydrogenase
MRWVRCEAVDFLRYYAGQVRGWSNDTHKPLGIVACISPWNFPLSIFTGQIAGALAAGNAVIAKPAEETPLIAAQAMRLFLGAGLPPGVLQLLPGTARSARGWSLTRRSTAWSSQARPRPLGRSSASSPSASAATARRCR